MDLEYLRTAVGRHLARALSEIAISRPDRPIEYLAYYLISLHEKELELQKRKEHKKSKSVSRVTEKDSVSDTAQTESKDKASPEASDTDETVTYLLSELVDKCVESYDPTVRDSLTDALSSVVADSQLESSGPPIVVGSDAHLDERIDKLIINPGENENQVLDAKVHKDMSQVYEVVSKTAEQDEKQNEIQ